jgi:tRNA1Val (adenine37-N6)-methyltransferase
MKNPALFQFKQFAIHQNLNPQKVGTDSMLLGAWSNAKHNQILDIGTGTGILALMLAQQNPSSKIVAIEPDLISLEEARTNFSESRFANQIHGIHSRLQDFKGDSKFDLIISNPPYFENSTLSENNSKNKVRHTLDLPIDDLYKHATALLSDDGYLNLIFPFDLEEIHFSTAQKHSLFPTKILRTKKENGEFKRSLVSYSFKNKIAEVSEMIVKYTDNRYSKDYIELTKDFYETDLSIKKEKNKS